MVSNYSENDLERAISQAMAILDDGEELLFGIKGDHCAAFEAFHAAGEILDECTVGRDDYRWLYLRGKALFGKAYYYAIQGLSLLATEFYMRAILVLEDAANHSYMLYKEGDLSEDPELEEEVFLCYTHSEFMISEIFMHLYQLVSGSNDQKWFLRAATKSMEKLLEEPLYIEGASDVHITIAEAYRLLGNYLSAAEHCHAVLNLPVDEGSKQEAMQLLAQIEGPLKEGFKFN
ncbi:hypothetical protein DRJ48_00755 [Candidatus Woesearchaeota archaeon]|nr:MAG: hypothetical protein DRJ48_00755 [Candidatus Woesearchaeota archaeon]